MSEGVLWKDGSAMKTLYHLENANDSSGNVKTLTNSGVSFVGGKFGYGAKFDAYNDRLYRNDKAGIDPDGDLTFMFWVKFNSLATNLLLLTIAGDGNRGHLIMAPSGIATYIGYCCGDGGISKSGLVTGRWYHFVCTCTSAGAMKLYVDGSYLGGDTATATATIDYVGLGFLDYVDSAVRCTVDEFAIWQEVKTYQWVKKYYAWATGKL